MRAVVQRVERAEAIVGKKVVGRIGSGFLVLLGIAHSDGDPDSDYICRKLLNLRIFSDSAGRMNRSLLEVGGEMLIVSQFTLYGDCRKGNRPSFIRAAAPEVADPMYRRVVEKLRAEGVRVETGRFQAHMKVSLVNSGPVTVIVDSDKQFY